MELRQWLVEVQRHARLPGPEEALSVLSAFLRTLGARLPSRDALDLAAELPHELATFVMSPPRGHGETFDYQEMMSGFAQLGKFPRHRAERYAATVGGLLREELDADTLYDVKQLLPPECAAFFAPLNADGEGLSRLL